LLVVRPFPVECWPLSQTDMQLLPFRSDHDSTFIILIFFLLSPLSSNWFRSNHDSIFIILIFFLLSPLSPNRSLNLKKNFVNEESKWKQESKGFVQQQSCFWLENSFFAQNIKILVSPYVFPFQLLHNVWSFATDHFKTLKFIYRRLYNCSK